MPTLLTLHDPATARRLYDEGTWRHETFYALLCRHAAERGGRWALRDARRRVTWRELLLWVDTLAEELEAAGLRRGERVSLWLPSRAEAVVAFLACARSGLVCNPSLHQNYTVGEIARLLERIGAAALFAETGYGADAKRNDVFAAARELPSMKRIWRLDPPAGRRALAPRRAFPSRAPGRGRRPPTTIPTRSSISPSPPARRGCRKASCIPTTRSSPTEGRWSRTGGTTTGRCC